MANADSITVVVKHGIRDTYPHWMPGPKPEIPVGRGILNAALVRQALLPLVNGEVKRYEDGMFHGEINTYAMVDLLDGISEYDAKSSGFTSIPARNRKLIVWCGVRWEVSPAYTEIRLFGPSSNMDNVVIIDLLDEPTNG